MELKEFGVEVEIYDPNADKMEVKTEYGIDLINEIGTDYSSVLIATSHDEFRNIESSFSSNTIFYSLNKR